MSKSFCIKKRGEKLPAPHIEYENLRGEMARKNLRITDLAAALEITRATLGKKLARKYPLTLDEAFILRDTFFPECTLEYLFLTKKG